MGSIQAVRLASMGGLLSRGDVFLCAADDRLDARAATRTFLRRANTSEAAPWMSTPPPIRGNDSHGREDDRTRPDPPARERALSQLVAVRRPVRRWLSSRAARPRTGREPQEDGTSRGAAAAGARDAMRTYRFGADPTY